MQELKRIAYVNYFACNIPFNGQRLDRFVPSMRTLSVTEFVSICSLCAFHITFIELACLKNSQDGYVNALRSSAFPRGKG